MKIKRFFATLSVVALLLPQTVFALDYGNIISDETFRDYRSFNKTDIQSFMDAQGGYTATLVTEDIDGVERTAADIIYNAARKYLINPKYLIAQLQKESSLLTISSPTTTRVNFAMGYGVCDSCDVNDPNVSKYAGFGKQMDFAAWQFDRYVDMPERYAYQAGNTYTIDGQRVTMKNAATAAGYVYTPHLHGNKNLATIWERWFARLLLSGTLAEDEDGNFWLIRGNEKRLIANETVLNLNFDTRKKINVSSSELAAYSTGRRITLPTNFFFRAPWGTVYYIQEDDSGDPVRRGVASPEVLRDLGVSPEMIFPATTGDIQAIPESDPITQSDYENRDKLLQSRETGGIIYLGRDGKGHALYGRGVYQANFPGWRAEIVDQSEIDALKRGDPVLFNEGDLITRKDVSGPVYVIVQDEDTGVLERRPFKSAEVFSAMGYSFANVLKVSEREINLHPRGRQIKTATQN